MLMRSIRRWVIALGLLWTLIMLLAGIEQWVIQRSEVTSPRPAIFEVPAQYQPEALLSPRTPCVEDWYSYYTYASDTRYCSVNVGRYTVYVAYSRASQQIIRASYAGQGETLGDLVLAWGRPTGVVQHLLYTEVHWLDQHKYLWAFDRRISPYAHHLYIIYTHELPPSTSTKLTAWAGFEN